MPDLIRDTNATTRSDLEEALLNLNASAKRTPRHYVERKAAVHARIDVLLTEWEAAT